MNSFNNAVHYGPNDAGASTLSIIAVVIGIIVASWFFGAAYTLLDRILSKGKDSE